MVVGKEKKNFRENCESCFLLARTGCSDSSGIEDKKTVGFRSLFCKYIYIERVDIYLCGGVSVLVIESAPGKISAAVQTPNVDSRIVKS